MRQRRCNNCSQPFLPQRKHQRFCSRRCRCCARNPRRQYQRYTERDNRAHAAWMAAMDGMAGTTCPVCNSMFAPRRSTKRYCSARCRLQAHRARTPSATAIRKRIEREMRKLDQLGRAARIRRAVRRP